MHDIELIHHDSKSDAAACAKLLCRIAANSDCASFNDLRKKYKIKCKSLQKYAAKKPRKISEKKIPVVIDTKKIDYNATCEDMSSLRGKSICLTGEFNVCTKNEMKLRLEYKGAKITSRVSMSTDFLLVGEKGSSAWKNASKGGTKIVDALNFIARGSGVKIISEKEFLKFVKEDAEQCSVS